MKNIFITLLVLASSVFADNWIRVSIYEANNKINPEVSVSVQDTIDTITGLPTPDTSFLYIYTYKIKAKPYPREHDYWYVSYFDTVNKVYRTEKVDSGASNYTQSITEIDFGLTDTIVDINSIKWDKGVWRKFLYKPLAFGDTTDPYYKFHKNNWTYRVTGWWKSAEDSIHKLSPGDSLTITFTSRGLPAISQMHFVGTSRGDDPIKVVYGYTDYEFPKEVFADPYGGRAVYTVILWSAPVPDPFSGKLILTQGQLMIDSLRSWIDKSVQLGWLDERLSGRLKRKLDPVEKYMWEGRGENHARHSLLAFMSILERNRNRGVKDEAYFVLYYNARYLLSYLPRGGPQ